MSAELLLVRTDIASSHTGGALYLGPGISLNRPHCFTLEDPKQPKGVKVDGMTCIPPGRYQVALSKSVRFGRIMPMLYNCSNGYELKADGISFKGIRIHGGNTIDDTEGCILVAFNLVKPGRIQGSAERSVVAFLKEHGGVGWIEIREEPKSEAKHP